MRAIMLLAGMAVLTGSALASDRGWREPSGVEVERVKAAAELILKDAESAKYQGLKASASLDGESVVICGLFNAKNSYGGYAGYESFIYSTSDNEFRAADGGANSVLIDVICNK